MVAHSAGFSRWLRSHAFFSLLLLFSAALFSAEKKAAFLTFDEVAETLRLFADSGLPGSDIADSGAWDRWIRDQDAQVRARIDRGVEDSISNLVLYGSSYTSLPRMESSESAVTEAGKFSEPARARVHALFVALGAATANERVRIVRDFLARKGIARDGVQKFLTENLERFAIEQRDYQKKLEEAGKSGDPGQVMFTRGTLYQTRGLSADTSLLPNYALEDSLRALVSKGVLAAGKIRRIAVVGPGLDFTDKRDGYDFYPLQTIQPFAVMEAVLRQKLGKAEEMEVATLDLNPGVNAHVAKLARDARAGRAYTVQLPRDIAADWAPAAVAYWQHFGEILGTQAKPIPVPLALGGVTLRAVAIAPRFASRVTPLDLNIVAQRMDIEEGQGFDLVVATNILVYYDRFQQALAMASIARMMNPGGIFLANNVLPAQHVESLEYLGRRTVAYATDGSYGDDVVVYRRR
jgi:SAM-dependent methyltransferase